jgi:hypothetical protein
MSVSINREEDRDCGERRGGVVYKREIVTPYWETIKIIIYMYMYIYIYIYIYIYNYYGEVIDMRLLKLDDKS